MMAVAENKSLPAASTPPSGKELYNAESTPSSIDIRQSVSPGIRLYQKAILSSQRKEETRRRSIQIREDEEMASATFEPKIIDFTPFQDSTKRSRDKEQRDGHVSLGERLAGGRKIDGSTDEMFTPANTSMKSSMSQLSQRNASTHSLSSPSRRRLEHEKLVNRSPHLVKAREERLEAIRRLQQAQEDNELTFTPKINDGIGSQVRKLSNGNVAVENSSKTPDRSFLDRLADMFILQKLERESNQCSAENKWLTEYEKEHKMSYYGLQEKPTISAYSQMLEREGNIYDRLYSLSIKSDITEEAKSKDTIALESGGLEDSITSSGHDVSHHQISDVVESLYSDSQNHEQHLQDVRHQEQERILDLMDRGRRMNKESRTIYKRRLEKEFVRVVARELASQIHEEENLQSTAECLQRSQVSQASIQATGLSKRSVANVLRAMGFLLPCDATDRRISRYREENKALSMLYEVFDCETDGTNISIEQLFEVICRARMGSAALGCDYIKDIDGTFNESDSFNEVRSNNDTHHRYNINDLYDSNLIDYVAEHFARLYKKHNTYMHTSSTLKKDKKYAYVPFYDRKHEDQCLPEQSDSQASFSMSNRDVSPSPSKLKYQELPFSHGSDLAMRQAAAKRAARKREMKECTFHPKTSQTKKYYDNVVRSKCLNQGGSFEQTKVKKPRDKVLHKTKSEIEDEEECTFKPNLTSTRKYYMKQVRGMRGHNSGTFSYDSPLQYRVHSCLLALHDLKSTTHRRDLVAISDAKHDNVSKMKSKGNESCTKRPDWKSPVKTEATPIRMKTPSSHSYSPFEILKTKEDRVLVPKGLQKHVQRTREAGASSKKMKEALTPRRPLTS